ncbi:hypothetical protein P3H15_36355 [Rhodococcus sp. T2V]|nr:hypothetical protein [Rhodococcus sp. T2V]MDF3310492.1 hypothetical protein [Rhodococcus sp. T2V]
MKRHSELVAPGAGGDEPGSHCRLWDLLLWSVIAIAAAVGVAAVLTAQ